MKDAEEVSEINSDTENNEYLKKSRKMRAAKIFDDSSSNDELLEEDVLISELPENPDRRSTTIHTVETKTAKNTGKGKNAVI